MSLHAQTGSKGALIVCSLIFGLILGLYVLLSTSLEEVPTTERKNVGTFWEPRYEDVPTTRSVVDPGFLSVAFSFAVGLCSSLLYPCVGALAVKGAVSLHRWAYMTDEVCEDWKDMDRRLLFGAFWPITLLAAAIVYVFLGIGHRIF